MDNIEVYQDDNEEWRFRIKGRNGEIVATGEGYSVQASAFRGAETLKRIMAEQIVLDKAQMVAPEPPAHDGGQPRMLTSRVDEIISAAHCYLSAAHKGNSYDYRMVPMDWPWKRSDWRPGTRLENIEKAASLLSQITGAGHE